MKKNTRIIAIRHMKDGVAFVYGEGVYLGDKVPDTAPFNNRGLHNPCMRLDSGELIWGFQCWWGPLDSFKTQIEEGNIILGETVPIDFEIIAPITPFGDEE